ncbi:unnamed protein product [Alopecurus aequalis]
MHQPPYMPVGSVDPETQGGGLGRQEGSWMEAVQLKINKEAAGVSLSIPPYFRRFDQINNEKCPSIFMPRRQVPPMPVVAQTAAPPSLDLTDGAAGSRGPAQSRGGNIIVAAVGPYHHHQTAQPPLITHAKKCAIVKFLARREFGLDTVDFLGWALRNDALARECYERDSITMAPQELAEMLLLDGCLVLFAVFLLRSSVREDRRPAELARSPSRELGEEFIYLSADISLHMKPTRLDLLLLGNQIPFFVLTELHRRLKDTFFRGIQHSIQELALSCFDGIRPGPSLVLPQQEITVHHLLHLFHWSRVPQGKHAVDTTTILLDDPETNLPCATWFEDSLTRFSKHAAPSSSSSSLNIVFQRKMFGARGVLRVPPLHIHGYSELLFRNLIAFEQSHLRCGLGVTAYCICMGRLLQGEDDAKLLRKSGILAHSHETDKEIVDLFRALAEEYRDTFYSKDLLDLCKDVAAHHRTAAARAVKCVVLQCFPRQTVTFFVILGAFISIATLINTIYSLIRFYHPVKH